MCASLRWKMCFSDWRNDACLMIELRQVATLANKEFRDRIRNRWVLAIAVVFAAFALVIAYFGAAQQTD